MTSESEIREKRERFMDLWKSMKDDPSKIQQASVILDVIALLDRILLTEEKCRARSAWILGKRSL
jgi:hypothetical protein